MLVAKILNGKFYCGFCSTKKGLVITETDVTQWTGNGKERVSNQILCKTCGRHISQKNQINKGG